MNLTFKCILYIGGLLCALPVFSQTPTPAKTSKITGKLTTAQNEPLMYAAVALLSTDSAIVNSGISLPTGDFTILDVAAGTYLVQVTHLECEKYTSAPFSVSANETKNLPAITVSSAVNSLQQVEISANKALIEIKADKLIFNVESSPSAAGTNGLELLKKAPGVVLDLDNNISLLGKENVEIYVNGVPSNLSGHDLTSFLQSLTSDMIESIEIISSPSSKYDAEGSGGIINIVMKKNMATGFNGSVASSFTKGTEYRYNNSLALNYGTEKVITNFDFTQSFNNYLEFFDDIKQQNNSILDLHSKENSIVQGINTGVSTQIQLGEKHTLIGSVRVIFNNRDNDLTSTTDIYQANPPEYIELLASDANLDGTSGNYVLNLNHVWNFNKSSSLNTNVSFGTYDYQSRTEQPNTYYDPDGSVDRDENNAFNSDTRINLASAKVDYDKSWDKITFSAGVKFSHILTKNSFEFFNIIGGQAIPNKTKSNDFDYDENVAAAYTNLNFKINPFLSVNAGLRAENTSSKGTLTAAIDIDNKDVKRDYLNFFPNVSLSFDKQKDHAWSVLIGRRITRPNYQDLNPFEFPTSQLVIWKGNPFLNPNYIMNYQLSYIFKKKIVLTGSYSETTDFFARIIEQTGEVTTQIIPRNLDKVTNWALSISCPISVNKYYELLIYGTVSELNYSGNPEGTTIDLETTQWNYRIQNNFYLPADILLDITFSQRSDWVWRGSVYMKGNYQLDFGVRKDFFDNRLQVRITGQDIFKTGNALRYSSDYGGIVVNGAYTYDGQRFGAGATLKFGNQKAKNRVKKSDALEEELDRIGN